MTDALPPPEGVIPIGGAAYRLPGRYAPVFLRPPEYRTYVAADGAARVYREYDLATGEPVGTLIGPDHYGTVSRPSADGTRIAVETRDGVRVLDLTGGRVLLAVPPEPEVVRFAFAPTGDRLAVLVRNPDTEQREADGDMEDSYVRAVVVYDVGGGPLQEIRPLVNFGVHACFSADGRLLATAGRWYEEYDDQPPPFDGPAPVQVWDAGTGAEVARIHSDEEYGVYAASAAAGALLLCSSHDGAPAALHDFATGRLIRKYAKEGYPRLEQPVLSSDGGLLVGVRSSGELVRRDARTGAAVDATPCPFRVTPSPTTVHDDHTKQIAFRADGAVVVLRVAGQSVEVWTAPDGRAVTRTVGGTEPIIAVGFAETGRELRTAGRGESVVRRWDAATGAPLGQTELPATVVECCLGRVWFAPGDRLVAKSRYGSAVFHLATREVRFTPPVYEEASLGESLSADGWRVSLPTHYMSTSDAGVRIEHVVNGGPRGIYRFDGTTAAATYDRGRVLLMYDDRRGESRTAVCLRADVDRGEVLWSRTLSVGPEFRKSYRSGVDHARVNFSVSDPAVLWAPDGASALLIPRRERIPFLIDPTTGETVSVWAAAVGWPHAVHPSRPVLATATADGDGLILADWRTGARLATVQEGCYPHALAWSPDGTRLVASLPDGTARVFVWSSL